jgi:hypothetical protein
MHQSMGGKPFPRGEPTQEPGNGGTGGQERGSVISRPARQYRSGRGCHVENTIMNDGTTPVTNARLTLRADLW